MNYSKISVITPSFNQGRFIEQTILSVIGQQYPNLEYIIIDGGSTDETINIIEKHAPHITHWISEKDSGQSNAINKGFALATGQILCWLNSDDYYLPGTLFHVNEKLRSDKAELLFGNCIYLNEKTNDVHGSYFDPVKKWDINQGDYIVQPSSFWTRKAQELTGPLREDLHFGFDWEWFARAKKNNISFIPSKRSLSIYRIHDQQKSNDNNIVRSVELMKIRRQLNPNKFNNIDRYLQKHINSVKFIYGITDNRFLKPLEYQILNMVHPYLMKMIDRIGLKQYIDNYYLSKKTHK